MISETLLQYIHFQELRINAKAELDVLVAKNSKLIAKTDKKLATEIEVRIINQQTYISRIESIIKKWSDALMMLAQTYNKKEYEMFVKLIVEGRSPYECKKWTKSECNVFINKISNQIQKLQKDDKD